MDIKTINARLSVGPQITPAEVTELARRGYHTIICNRPDNEDPGQPSFAEIAAAAGAQGLEAHHIPVVPGALTDGQVEEFEAALRGCRARRTLIAARIAGPPRWQPRRVARASLPPDAFVSAGSSQPRRTQAL